MQIMFYYKNSTYLATDRKWTTFLIMIKRNLISPTVSVTPTNMHFHEAGLPIWKPNVAFLGFLQIKLPCGITKNNTEREELCEK